MAQAPALLRTNTTPVFPTNNGMPSVASIAASRASQLSGSTAFTSASSTSLASMNTTSTLVAPASGPVRATTNIINQKADASRSLYQICVGLKQRLSQVPSFLPTLQQLEEDAATGDDGGPVESLWNLLRTGYPLLTIYNALEPAEPLKVEDSAGTEAKRSKIAVFKFVQACLRELKIPANDCFVINDLLGNDTTGFVKVTSVVNYVLDLAEERGLLTQAQQLADEGGDKKQLTYRDHIIKELVDTERKYVQDLENLHDLKKVLEQSGAIPGDIVHQIFLNINAILDFQRRFLIRVETTNSMPQPQQQWGTPFAAYEEAFSIYQPFIANQRKAAQIANQVFDKIKSVEHPVAVDFNTLDGFLLKPMQRLVKYPLLLKDLSKKSDDSDVKAELSAGIDAAERVLQKANEAVDRDLLDEALDDLILRVEDWKNHRVEQFGRLLLHGVYTVVTGRSDQEKDYEIFLFECILLCCKEILPAKTRDKKDKTKSTGPKIRNKNNKLQLKGRIFMTNVTEVIFFSKPGSYTVQIWWKGDPGVENFVIKFTNEDTMKKWASGLDAQRKENAPSASATPEQPPKDFAWMQNVDMTNMENPYANQDEEDDDDHSSADQSLNMGFGGQQQSTGGVLARANSSNSLSRMRSTTNDSTLSLTGLARQPPPRFPLPPPPLQTGMSGPTIPSPGPRGGDSYFSPTAESPNSSRTSGTSSMFQAPAQFAYPGGTPQGWEDNQRYTAPAMPRAPSRDGASPVNAYTVNGGRNPRGPSLPAMASQQSLAQQQRSRSYSTPDIQNQQNGNGRRTNSNTPVPAVPGIPAHLHHDGSIPRSQSGSPRNDIPVRSNTQSPGTQRERLNQQNGSYGGAMGQFPAQPIYPRQNSIGGGAGAAVPPPLNIDRHTPVSPPLGTASTVNTTSTSDLPFPTQLKVKVNCENNSYVTLVVAFNITYQSLIDRIDAKLARFTTASIGKGGLGLRYKDEDGDLVNIDSDDDIQIAFMEWREGVRNMYAGGVGEIELFCVGETN